jgi:hypothetical protein
MNGHNSISRIPINWKNRERLQPDSRWLVHQVSETVQVQLMGFLFGC